MKKYWLLPTILVTFLWGSAFAAVKSGYSLFGINTTHIPSVLVFAGIRFVLAGFLTLIIRLLLTKKMPHFTTIPWINVMAVAAVYTFLQYVCFYIGLTKTSGTNASIISGSNSFLPVILAHFMIREEPFTKRKAISITLGMLGIILLNLGGSSDSSSLFGDFLIFLAALSGSYGSILNKFTVKKMNSFDLTGLQLFIGGLGLLVFGLLSGGTLFVQSNSAYPLMFYLGLLSAIAFSLWTLLLRDHEASKISVFLSLVPVWGVLGSWLILDENIFSWKNLIALILIITAIIVLNYQKKNKKKEEHT